MPGRRPTRRCATPRCSSACSTKTWACSGRSASTASRSTTASGSTSISSGIQQADARRIVTERPAQPEHRPALRRGAGDRAGAAGLQRGRQRADLDRDDADPAGLARRAWRIRSPNGCGCGRRSARPIARPRGIFEFLERRPELHQNVGAHFLNALKEQITLENVDAREPLRAAAARRASRSRFPAGSRTAIMGQDDDPKLALVCLIPRLIDPQVRPRPDRRPRPPRRHARLGSRPGRHRASGRPGLHRLGAGEHRPGRPDEHPAAHHRGRQAGPCPPLHPGPAARLRHDRSARSVITSSPTSSSGSRWPGPTCTTRRS